MISVAAIATVGAGLLLAYMLWRLIKGPAAHLPLGTKVPPVIGGYIPWLGCAITFGKEPLWFVGKAYKKFGDLFTIHVAGKWITFLFDPEKYHHFFTSSAIDFQAAVRPICHRVAGVEAEFFMKDHIISHETLKGRISSTTPALCLAMCTEFNRSLASYGDSGEKDIVDFVQEALFEAITRELFGKDNAPLNKADMLEMMEIFKQYDEGFEHGSDLPEFLVGHWSKNKYKLLNHFKKGMDSLQKHEGNGRHDGILIDTLLPISGPEHLHHHLLLIFWAAHANATPVVYWTLGHILSNPDILKRALKEVEEITLYKGDRFKPLEESELKKTPFIKRCVMESARLHAPGAVVRKVVKTHTIKGYTIPAGHMMFLCPYWAHRNETLFPDPEAFKPDRWLACDLDKNQFLKGFIPFGGGKFQCSGKVFAVMEMHLFVVMVLKMFDLEMKDPLPPESPAHLLGTTHPTKSCRIKYTRKI